MPTVHVHFLFFYNAYDVLLTKQQIYENPNVTIYEKMPIFELIGSKKKFRLMKKKNVLRFFRLLRNPDDPKTMSHKKDSKM